MDMSGLRYLLWAMALCGVCVSASAQSSDVDQIEAGLKQRTAELQQISDQLDAGDVSDKKLAADLQTLLDLQTEFQEIDQALKTAQVEPSQRLSDLGPPPAEGQPVDSDDITELRETLGDEVTRLTGLIEIMKQETINGLELAILFRLAIQLRENVAVHRLDMDFSFAYDENVPVHRRYCTFTRHFLNRDIAID